MSKQMSTLIISVCLLLVHSSSVYGESELPFHPTKDVSACLLWLDGHDSGLEAGAAQAPKLLRWQDKSGKGHHAGQENPLRAPSLLLNENETQACFDGGAFLELDLSWDWSRLDWTLFVIASLDKEAKPQWRGIAGNRFGRGAKEWWTLGTKSDGNVYLELGAGGGVLTNLKANDGRLHVYAVVKQGATFSLYRDGLCLGSAEKEKVGGRRNELRLGCWYGEGQYWQGGIGEFLLYKGALSETEQRRIAAYLAEKWRAPVVPALYAKQGSWSESMVLARRTFLRHDFSGALEEAGALALDQVWRELCRDFPEETQRLRALLPEKELLSWFRQSDQVDRETAIILRAGQACAKDLAALQEAQASPDDPRWLSLADRAAQRHLHFQTQLKRLDRINLQALARAVQDLGKEFPNAYAEGAAFEEAIEFWNEQIPTIKRALEHCEEDAVARLEALEAFQRKALLSNPLLDFEDILVVQRGEKSPSLGLPQNWQSNCVLPNSGFNDALLRLSLDNLSGEMSEVYRPERPAFLGDVELHFDGKRLLYSSIGSHDKWQVFELNLEDAGVRQVTLGDQDDVNNYDACYLPDEDIMFCSTAYMAAVPCVNGSTRTANLYRMKPDGSQVRQLCFDQEHNWCPTMLPNGRVMYLRWEYTDTPHSHDRVLFHMNPDGTGQMEYYGSNSYWPNALFYARPLPGKATQFVGIVGGHHGVRRMGELVTFDSEKGRRESSGALQRIPGYGLEVASTTDPRYESSLIQDRLVDDSWPKFLHPYPLNDKYFLVSCKPTPEALWGVYLVDVFDNMLLLREAPGQALFEPTPLRKSVRPPIVPDKVDLDRKDAVVYLADVYAGEGLKGVPRGTVKALRLLSYHFLYPAMGGPQAVVGMEGPWDIKRIMGTVPVEDDGSAIFRIPANTPIAVQPLDAEGKALQLMRSWFTAMPGEVLSCVGCHEAQSTTPLARRTLASQKAPAEIAPWYGPERGFNFDREVQPVLDRYCVRCHDGQDRSSGPTPPDFKTRDHITDYTSVFHHGGKDAGHFSVAYANLHRYVRRPGLESDYHLLMPLEFHADTTQLVQRLKKGHGGAKLDPESWDRLLTWIDLNAPFHGTWTEIAGKRRVRRISERRRELLKLYADMDTDPEAIYSPEKAPLADLEVEYIPHQSAPETAPVCEGWPFDATEAQQRQALAQEEQQLDAPLRSIDLGEGVSMNLVLTPAGDFLMGEEDAYQDEAPRHAVTLPEAFWMGQCEVTNAQFARFDPDHDSRVESRFSMQFGVRGFYVNGPEQPVVRVSWEQAMAFCKWLSEKSGLPFTLPTEAQWEYACRAGAATPFYYGGQDTDFSPFANLADEKLREFVCHTYKKEREPWLHASKYDDWIPKESRFNDGGFLSDTTAAYQPNAWGLHDMHGNVAEWTRSAYRAYPYVDNDGRNEAAGAETRVVRGGSWRDRPLRARASYRLAYRPYQGVYNVGFRVVCPATQAKEHIAQNR